MEIGDKVRFLNDVGGGIITGFKGKDMVLVCDSDGFEIPTLRTEVVVIETNSLNIAKKQTSLPTPHETNISGNTPSKKDEIAPTSNEEKNAFQQIEEREDGDKLRVFLAFVPINIKKISETSFEAYLINDCNYFIRYLILARNDENYSLRYEGEIEPNTKVFLEEFEHDKLNKWERLTIQMFSYKREKAFSLKPSLSVDLRIEGTKFFKLHAFQSNNFFEEPALLYDIVVDDYPSHSLVIDTKKMFSQESETSSHRTNSNKKVSKPNKRQTIVEVDLHASELLDTMVGMKPKDILDYQLKVFRDTMNEHIKEHGCRIVFIHGKGEGVLRNAILTELEKNYPKCKAQDASFREYGFGATQVTI